LILLFQSTGAPVYMEAPAAGAFRSGLQTVYTCSYTVLPGSYILAFLSGKIGIIFTSSNKTKENKKIH